MNAKRDAKSAKSSVSMASGVQYTNPTMKIKINRYGQHNKGIFSSKRETAS